MTFKLKAGKLELSENDIEAQVIAVLGMRNWLVVRTPAGLFRSPDLKRWIKGQAMGFPDYICLHHKYLPFLMETKAPGKKPSPEQVRKHREIEICWKIPIAVVDSVEGLITWLKARGLE